MEKILTHFDVSLSLQIIEMETMINGEDFNSEIRVFNAWEFEVFDFFKESFSKFRIFRQCIKGTR